MRELLIATRNKGKYPEFIVGLGDVPFVMKSVNDIPELRGFDPEETGATFEENAILKARAYGNKTGMLTIADDSGLVIDALGGRPGIFSARYAPGSDADRYAKVLEEMASILDDARTARFISVIAIYEPRNGAVRTCEGICEGRIMRAAHGDFGFGYDPIFYADELGACFAELPTERKSSADHRGKALTKARKILLQEFV